MQKRLRPSRIGAILLALFIFFCGSTGDSAVRADAQHFNITYSAEFQPDFSNLALEVVDANGSAAPISYSILDSSPGEWVFVQLERALDSGETLDILAVQQNASNVSSNASVPLTFFNITYSPEFAPDFSNMAVEAESSSGAENISYSVVQLAPSEWVYIELGRPLAEGETLNLLATQPENPANGASNETGQNGSANGTNSTINETTSLNETNATNLSNQINITYSPEFQPDFSNLLIQAVNPEGAATNVSYSILELRAGEWAYVELGRALAPDEYLNILAIPFSNQSNSTGNETNGTIGGTNATINETNATANGTNTTMNGTNATTNETNATISYQYAVVSRGGYFANISFNGSYMEISEEVLQKLENNETVRVIAEMGQTPQFVDGLAQINSYPSMNLYIFQITDVDVGKLVAAGFEKVYLDREMHASLADSLKLVGADRAQQEFNASGSGVGVCVLDSANETSDDNGHGTAMASIISAMAPGASIIPIKVLNSTGAGYSSDAIGAISSCVEQSRLKNIKIIFIGFGGGSFNGSCGYEPVSAAAEYAVSDGLMVVAPSGNDGSYSLNAPACAENATAVASSTKSDTISAFSNLNPSVALLAPGENLTVPVMGENQTVSGTSAAAAHVAGAAALLFEKNPGLSPKDAENILKATGVPIESGGISYPRIDIFAALNSTMDVSAPVENATEITLVVQNQDGAPVPATVSVLETYDAFNIGGEQPSFQKSRTAFAGAAQNAATLRLKPGSYTVTVQPSTGGKVKKLTINGYEVGTSPSQQAITISDAYSPAPEPPPNESNATMHYYSIGFSGMNFTNATALVSSESNALYKCGGVWDSAANACKGKWFFSQYVDDGSEYGVDFTPDITGFREGMLPGADARPDLGEPEKFYVDGVEYAKPQAYRPKFLDEDDNGLRDSLEYQISKSPDKEIGVIVTTYGPVTDADVADFQSLGGNVRHVYSWAGYGYAGTIRASAIPELAAKLGSNLCLAEEDIPLVMDLDHAMRVIMVRPTVWQTYGYMGSANNSIVSIDTGADPTHADTQGYINASSAGWGAVGAQKIVGWEDVIGENNTPVAIQGHGAHTSSIAVGTGAAYGNGSKSNITVTFEGDTYTSSPSAYSQRYNVPSAGIMTINYSIGGASGNRSAYCIFPNGTAMANMSGPMFGPNEPLVVKYNASVSGVYTCYFSINSTSLITRPFSALVNFPYQDVGDGYNLFTGVAPQNKLVVVKIMNNAGTGFVSDMEAGYDWVVANKAAYHIKAATTSITLGGASSPTTDVKANAIVENGIPFTISAGNGFCLAAQTTVGSPSVASKAIAVGATDYYDQISYYSSNGAAGSGKPDVVAPGGGLAGPAVCSADSNFNDADNASFADRNLNDSGYFMGTSASAPQAGGLLALMVQAWENSTNSSWNYTEDSALRMKQIMLMTAWETNKLGEYCSVWAVNNSPTLNRGAKDLVEGFGRINADAAIEALTMSYSPGTQINVTLNGSEFGKKVWARKMQLSPGTTYNFNLTVPSTADFDMYLYYKDYNTTSASIGDPIIYQSSVNAGNGANESFSAQVPETGTYYLVVKDVNGTGAFSLSSLGAPAAAGVAGDAIIAYRSNTGFFGLNSPKIRFWNASGAGSWSSELELPSAGSPVRYAVVKWSPATRKVALVALSDSGNLTGYVCMDNCTNVSNWVVSPSIGNVWAAAPATSSRRFDMDFETTTGNLMLVYSILDPNSAHDLAYRVLAANETNLSATAVNYIDDTGHATDIRYTWVRTDRKPTASREIALIGFDSTDTHINAWIWNGTVWGNQASVTDASASTGGYEALAVRYASNGSKALVMGGDSTATRNIAYRYWNGTAWSAATTFRFGVGSGNVQFINIKADPASDNLQAVITTIAPSLFTAYWNGTTMAFSASIDAGLDSAAARCADFEWNRTGSVGKLVWDTDGIGNTLSQRDCAPQCTAATTTFSAYAGTGAWLTMYRNPSSSSSVNMLNARLNSAFGIGSFTYNGTGYNNYGDTAIANTTTVSTFEAYSIAFNITEAQPPSINFTSPTSPNGTTIYVNYTYINTSITDNTGVSIAYLEWNGTSNITMNSISNSNWFINKSGLADGLYSYKAYGNDSGNNWGVSETRTITIDTTPPVITFLTPTPGNGSVQSVDWAYINITSNENLTSALLEWNGTNQSMSGSGTNWFINKSGLADGLYSYKAYGNDSGNNWGVSETRTVYHAFPPSVIILSPLGDAHYQTGQVSLSVNATDPFGIDTGIAQVAYPNGSKSNFTLYRAQQGDNFSSNTIGTSWIKENISIGPSQTCIADINATYAGKAFTSLSGNGGPETDTLCSLIAAKPMDGDFDISISFNVTGETGADNALNFQAIERNSSATADELVFISLSNWTGLGRNYEIYLSGENFSGYIYRQPTEDTHGKLRIVRSANDFSFYIWNNTNDSWYLANSTSMSICRPLYPAFESESALPSWGSMNVTWDDFSAQGDGALFRDFGDTLQLGLYNVTFFVNNTLGAMNNSERTNFTVFFENQPPTTPFILTPSIGSVLNGTQAISWSAVFDYENDLLNFNITLLNPDGSDNATIVSNYGDINSTSYPWNTSLFPDGEYSMRVTVFENETPEQLSNSYTLPGTFFIDNNPPAVAVLAPLGESHQEKRPVSISINATDSFGISSAIAQITMPNGTATNLTLGKGQQSDEFSIDSLDVNWTKENVLIGPSQTCLADINTSIPGKAYTSLTGDGTPLTDTLCTLVSKDAIDGDFDISIDFSIENETGIDHALNFQITRSPTSAGASRTIFIALSNWTGLGRNYEIFADDGNFSGYILSRPTEDTSGKMRIKRVANNFTFYTWNSSANGWTEENVSQNEFDFARAVYVSFESESAYPGWGAMSVSWDNFTVNGSNSTFGMFNETAQLGLYNVSFFVNDTHGLENNSERTNFTIVHYDTPPSTPYLLAPFPGEFVSGMYNITWSGVNDFDDDSLQFNITLLNPDGTFNSTLASNYGNINSTTFEWNTSLFDDGNYSMEIIVFENETPEGLSNSYTMLGNFTIQNNPPSVQFEPPTEISGSSVDRNYMLVNVSAFDPNLNVVEIDLYNSTGSLINQSFSPTSPLFENFTNLSEGTYYFNATALDNIGHQNWTETRNVTLGHQTCIVISAPGAYAMAENYSGAPNAVPGGDACVVINASDVEFDCSGYSITGNGTGIGVFTDRSNITIRDCVIGGYDNDMALSGASNSAIINITYHTPIGLLVENTNDTVYYNLTFSNITDTGIYVTGDSNNNSFSGIEINNTGTSYGIYVDGGSLNSFDCAGRTLSGDSSSGSAGFYVLAPNVTVENCSIAGYDSNFYAESSSGLRAKGINSSNAATYGFRIASMDSSSFSDTIIENSGSQSMSVLSTTNSVFSNFTVLGPLAAMSLSDSIFENSTIDAQNLGDGLYIGGSGTGVYNNLTISNADTCVQFTARSSGNILANSTILNCTTYGVHAYGSTDNIIYNNIINATTPAYEQAYRYTSCSSAPGCHSFPACHPLSCVINGRYEGSPNQWDFDDSQPWNSTNIINGPWLGGNYYAQPDGAGYSETCGASLTYAGICSAPYVIPSSLNYADQDYYPLTYNNVSCPIISAPGSYALASDLTGAPNNVSEVYENATACVKIISSDVVLDCAGHSISGNNSENVTFGVLIVPFNNPFYNGNVTLVNCTVSNYTYGIKSYSWGWMENITLINDTAYDNSVGMDFDSGDNWASEYLIANSTAYGNGVGFHAHGYWMGDSSFINNTAYGNSIAGFYFYNFSNGAYRINVSDSLAYNNTGYGFYFERLHDGTMNDSLAYNNTEGFAFEACEDNLIYNDSAYNNSESGFYIGSVWDWMSGVWAPANPSVSNTFENNTAYNNTIGFFANVSPSDGSGGSGNLLQNNSAYNNSLAGFYLNWTSYNSLFNNTAFSNGVYGFYVGSGDITAFSGGTFANPGIANPGSPSTQLAAQASNPLQSTRSFSTTFGAGSGGQKGNGGDDPYIGYAEYNILEDNSAYGNANGFYLTSTESTDDYTNYSLIFNQLINNFAFNNSERGYSMFKGTNHTFSSNIGINNTQYGIILANSPANYLNLDNITESEYGIALTNFSFMNNLSYELAWSNSFSGFLLDLSGQNLLDNCQALSNGEIGFHLNVSAQNNLSYCTAQYNGETGFLFNVSDNNTVESPFADSNNAYGLYVDSSNGNNFTSATVQFHQFGFYLLNSTYSQITGSNISNSSDSGVYIEGGNTSEVISNVQNISAYINISGTAYTFTPIDVSGATDVHNGDSVSDYGNYTLRADDEAFTYELPFVFPYMGRNITSISANTNGMLELLETGETQQFDGWLGVHSFTPYAGLADLIFISNDDLQTFDNPPSTYMAVINLGDRVVVEWNGSTFWDYSTGNSSTNPIHFQTVLYPNGTVEWNYENMSFANYSADMFSGAYAKEENTEFTAGYAIRNQSSYTYDFNITLPAGPSANVSYGAFNTVADNGIFNNTNGVSINASSANTINSNAIHECAYGFFSTDANSTQVAYNALSGNGFGLWLSGGSSSIMNQNNISYNANGGLTMDSASSGSSLQLNYICFNDHSDLNNSNPSNNGSADSCDYFNGWAEDGHGGCTYACTSVWQRFLGNVSGSIVLTDANNADYVRRWSAKGFAVYFADYDSAINWQALQAIGRNTTNGTSSSDFEELDVAFNTTAFNDSINHTYSTDGTHPIETANYTVFGNDISYVPVANSTLQSTVFKTGILWDTSGGGSEYSNAYNQSTVWMVRVNSSINDTYGIYDYLAQVPYTLGATEGSNNVVAIYLELQ